jgi:hypothetical protein
MMHTDRPCGAGPDLSKKSSSIWKPKLGRLPGYTISAACLWASQYGADKVPSEIILEPYLPVRAGCAVCGVSVLQNYMGARSWFWGYDHRR